MSIFSAEESLEFAFKELCICLYQGKDVLAFYKKCVEEFSQNKVSIETYEVWEVIKCEALLLLHDKKKAINMLLSYSPDLDYSDKKNWDIAYLPSLLKTLDNPITIFERCIRTVENNAIHAADEVWDDR